MLNRKVAAVAATMGLVGLAVVARPADAARQPIVDGFDRTVAAGWGRTASGATWAGPTGPFASRVLGSTAQVDLVAGRETRARLDASDFAQPTVASSFIVPAWTSVFFGVESRVQADGRAYRSRAYVKKDGTVEVEVMRRAANGTLTRLCAAPTGLKVAPGAELRVESRTTGSQPTLVQVRAYLAGKAAPAWQLRCSDNSSERLAGVGGVGVGIYSGTGGTVKVTDFSAADEGTVAPPAPVPSATSARPTASPTATKPSASASTTKASTNPSPTRATTSATATATATKSATASPSPSRATVASTTTSTTAAGSLPVGQASYPVPAGALHVATTGSDANPGTASQPLRTIAGGIARAASGQTIVVHGGRYHESGLRVPEGRRLTIQNAPGEAVWLDGSSTVTGFVASGSTWVKNNWGARFDSSPTYVRGAKDDGGAYWKFLNPSHSMAAHPDQVWVNGTRQRQVASAGEVKPGTFFVDTANRRLVLGTNPSGASVVASDLSKGLTILGQGTTVRGIGLRNYANSVPDMGVITVYAGGVTIENVEVQNPATAGIGVYRAGTTLRRVSVLNAGQLAVHGNLADNTVMDRLKVVNANIEHFNPTPAAGAVKFTTSRTITLRNSELTGTDGNAFWADESCYDIAVVGSTITNNTGRGIFLELSEKAVVVNNRLANNSKDDQIRIANTARVQIWNNTITGSSVPIHIAQDDRAPGTQGFAVDTRRPQPDPEMTWKITGTTIGNNVLESSGAVSGLLMVEDWSKRFTAEQMVALTNGNVYSRASSSLRWVVAWASGAKAVRVYTELPEFISKVGQERSAQYRSSGSVLTAKGTVRTDLGIDQAKALPLPADVANRAQSGAPTGVLGIWGR